MARTCLPLVSMSDDDSVGVIFPLVREHLQRFFEGQKRVFVKFLGRNVPPRKLQTGSRLFFYESRGGKEVVGEARIVEVGSGTVDEVLARFGNDLFLTRPELEEYAGSRIGNKMLVLVLEDVKRYAVPLRLDKSVTMAGQYMTKRMLKSLRANAY